MLFIATLFGMLTAGSVFSANDFSLSSRPLSVSVASPPNVFFMLDDSGSMLFEVLSRPYWHYSSYTQNFKQPTRIDSGDFMVHTSPTEDDCKTSKSDSSPVSSGSLKNEGVRFSFHFSNNDNLFKGCGRAKLDGSPSALLRDWRVSSSDFNVLYYDPKQVYQPWGGYPNAKFSAAKSYPDDRAEGFKEVRDLAADGGFRFQIMVDDKGFALSPDSNGPMLKNYVVEPNNQVDLWDTHYEFIVTVEGMSIVETTYNGPKENVSCKEDAYLETPAYKTCLGASQRVVTPEQFLVMQPQLAKIVGMKSIPLLQQNIANWYQYHRRRSFVAKAALAKVLEVIPYYRYGFSTINKANKLFIEVPKLTDNFDDHNTELLDDLYSFEQKIDGTPLRSALDTVGKYYHGKLGDKANPYLSQCQQSYSVLISDGYWNQNFDNSAITDQDKDGVSETLADVAQYYYETDLSLLPNKVPKQTNCGLVCDTNSKQHMTTFTLSFGLEGNLVDTDQDDWPNPFLNNSSDWGRPEQGVESSAAKIDDMWHAAFNSKGRFISAKTPQEVTDGLIDVLGNIASRANSGAAAAVNVGALSEGALLYATSYDGQDWSGDIKAFALDAESGEIGQTPVWSVAEQIDGLNPEKRVLLTYNEKSKKGVVFKWPKNPAVPKASELSPSQVAALTTPSNPMVKISGEPLLQYLRGDRSLEQDAVVGFVRQRGSALGDFVGSSPVYVGHPKRRYPDNWGAGAVENTMPYSAFRKTFKNRQPLLYAGANDGFLHGFDASESGGKELLAFAPSAVFERLPELAAPNFTHQFFVDETPVVEDVFFKSDLTSGTVAGWRTVLVGGLGAGGQSVYALDITNPENFSEQNAEELVLWEFTHPDLGYTFGKPAIGRMANGQWVVAIAGGVNSTVADGSASEQGNAVLFIVNAQTGELIKKLDTQVGSAQDPLQLDRPNGLWSPVLVDIDQNYVVDSIFAGDLFGHLWKWSVDSVQVSQWESALKKADKPEPLFTAVNASGLPQAITSRPEVGVHPTGSGVLVYFGTGQYFDTSDALLRSEQVNSFYGIWDETTVSVTRQQLLPQVIEREISASSITKFDLRQTSSRSIDWQTQQGWYMDLSNPKRVKDSRGERVIEAPTLRANKIIFTTFIPAGDTCEVSTSGWLMELDAFSGSRLGTPTLDIDNSNTVTSADVIPLDEFLNEVIYPSGLKDQAADAPFRPAIVVDSSRREFKYLNLRSGNVTKIAESPSSGRLGRQSWRRVR